MKIKILTLALIAIFAIGSTSLAQNPERGKRNFNRQEALTQRHDRVAERMDNFFTEEQQEQIKALRLETAKKVKPLKNQLNELEARQQSLTTAENADMEAIYGNIDKIAEVKSEIQKLMAKQHQDIRSLLSEEQLLKFDAMKDRRNRGFKNNRFQVPDRG